jgi:hypothetical protein
MKDKELLADVLDFLVMVKEHEEREVDIIDSDDGSPQPNTAMRLCSTLEGCEYETGLIERVEKALKESQ